MNIIQILVLKLGNWTELHRICVLKTAPKVPKRKTMLLMIYLPTMLQKLKKMGNYYSLYSKNLDLSGKMVWWSTEPNWSTKLGDLTECLKLTLVNSQATQNIQRSINCVKCCLLSPAGQSNLSL